MTLFVRRLLAYGFCFEVLLFFLWYYLGPNGMPALVKLDQQKKQLQQEIVQLQKDVDALDHNIKQGQTPFAKEKIARERLHMKKDKEIVYFVKKQG